jgi:hypothetical protein
MRAFNIIVTKKNDPSCQGCQRVYIFTNQQSKFGSFFWSALDWKMLVNISYAHLEYFRTFGILYGHLVHFVFIYYIFLVWVSCTNKNLATLSLSPVDNLNFLDHFISVILPREVFFACIPIFYRRPPQRPRKLGRFKEEQKTFWRNETT